MSGPTTSNVSPDPHRRQVIAQRKTQRLLGWCEMGRHVGGKSLLLPCPGSTPTGTRCECECHD